jgi:hypothetical protein
VGPENKIHIEAIPGDGGRVWWDGDEPKDPGAVRRPHPGAIVPHRQPGNEQRGAVQTKVEADAVVFDNERTNPKRAVILPAPTRIPRGLFVMEMVLSL